LPKATSTRVALSHDLRRVELTGIKEHGTQTRVAQEPGRPRRSGASRNEKVSISASPSGVEESEHRDTSDDVGEPISKGPSRAKSGAEKQNRWRE
jgi:hypothetical protein